jgi:hypothetical protein
MNVTPTKPNPTGTVRIYRPVVSGTVPDQTYVTTDGHFDYITSATINPDGSYALPDDTVFAMTMAEVLVPLPNGVTLQHGFAGWDPAAIVSA